jgi:hypothetical protein
VDGFVEEMTDAEKMRLEITKDIAQELHKQLREAVTSVGRSQSVGVALLAAIFAAAFARGAYGVLLVVPLALGLLNAYQAQLYCDVMVIAWQREQLLEQLRNSLGSDLLGERGPVDISRHGAANPSISLAHLGYFLLLDGSAIGGYVILAIGKYPLWALPVYTVASVIGVLAAHYGVQEQKVSWTRCLVLQELVQQQRTRSYEELTTRMLETLGRPGSIWIRARNTLRWIRAWTIHRVRRRRL